MKAGLLKKVAKGGLILGASVFAFAGAADAATYINLHGATAQYNFWVNYAPSFLGTLGCTVAPTNSFSTSDGKSTVTIGTGCTAIADAHNFPAGVTSGGPGDESQAIYFSYSNKASWDGVTAVTGQFLTTDEANGIPGNAEQTGANPCSPNANQRQVATCNNTTCSSYGVKTAPYVCQEIHIGTSDVEVAAFTQTSRGTIYGPLDPGDTQIHRTFTGSNAINISTLPGNPPAEGQVLSGYQSTSGYNVMQPEQPLAYPFSFYVNPGVQAYQCAAGSPAHVGSTCADDRNCGGSAGGTTYCQLATVSNLTRLQVVALFSGSIADWSNFGAAYPAHPVTVCLRHAGSGTSATLDWGIMEGNGWGASLASVQHRASTGTPPYIYFNDGTSDLKNCMNWAAGATFAGSDTLASGEEGGAVGYMDSDNANVTGMYTQVAYNGQFASRVAMHDGIYDNFWTINRMYVPAGLPQPVVDFYAAMLKAIDNPANLTDANLGGTRGETYGAASELNFGKSTSFIYPDAYGASTNPASPD